MAGVWIALCVLTAAAALNFGLRLLFLRKYRGKTLKKRFNPVGSMVE